MSRAGGGELQRLGTEIGNALRARDETLAIAESCTGGLIAATLTAVPGASDFFWGAAVVYTAHAKEALAGVAADTLERHGTVSAETTAELARGARARSGATYGLAVTGWAGPTAGPGSEVGEVHGALCHVAGIERGRWHFDGDRESVREEGARAVLMLLQGLLTAAQDDTDE